MSVSGQPIVRGNVLYYVKRVNSAGGGQFLAKFDLSTKIATVTTKRAAGTRNSLSSTAVYVLEDVPVAGGGGAQQTFRVAKFPLY